MKLLKRLIGAILIVPATILMALAALWAFLAGGL